MAKKLGPKEWAIVYKSEKAGIDSIIEWTNNMNESMEEWRRLVIWRNKSESLRAELRRLKERERGADDEVDWNWKASTFISEVKGSHQRFLKSGFTEQAFSKYLPYAGYIEKEREKRSRVTFGGMSTLITFLEREWRSKFAAFATEKTKETQDTSGTYKLWATFPLSMRRGRWDFQHTSVWWARGGTHR